VTYVVEPLNGTGSSYGPINRIVAGAWAETHSTASYLVVLDTDTVFVGAPEFVRADVAVRPVDMKGATSSGAADPLDSYWARMCELGGIDLDRLPRLSTTIDEIAIRASYNAGLIVVRRELGVLQQTRDIFSASFAENLRPRAGSAADVRASTGLVGREASEWWGSSQAALAIAIWSKTSDVHLFDERYNVPVHLLGNPACSWPTHAEFAPVLLHYHYLAEPQYQPEFRRVLAQIACPPDAAAWIEERISIFAT